MYEGVPMMAPDCVCPASSSFFAKPKSVIFGIAVLRQQHVGRLQIAVNDVVRRVPPASPAPASPPAPPLRAAGNGVPFSFSVKTAAAAELQGEERLALVFADLVHLHDIRMLQRAIASASVWKRVRSAAPAWLPARIIFNATTRFSLRCRAL